MKSMSRATPWTFEHDTGKPVFEEAAPVDRAAALRRLELLAKFLDDAFEIPGTRMRMGWDGVIGLVPFVGDAVTTGLAAYFMWEANRLGVSKWTLFRMLGNVSLDFLIGLVPLLGDVGDIAFKANRRNLRLLRQALD
jgi:hypothetical protein